MGDSEGDYSLQASRFVVLILNMVVLYISKQLDKQTETTEKK